MARKFFLQFCMISLAFAQLKTFPQLDQSVQGGPREFKTSDDLLVQIGKYLIPEHVQLTDLKESTVLVPFNQFDWCARYSFKVPSFEVFSDSAENPSSEAECKVVWFQNKIDEFKVLVDKNYSWAPTLDKIPAALRRSDSDELDYFSKIPLGYKGADGVQYIYNHLEMVVKLGLVGNKEDTYYVLGFEIEPQSTDHEKVKKAEKDSHNIDIRSIDQIADFLQHDEQEHLEVPQALLSGREFQFSYHVNFQLVDDIAWEHRMDKYVPIKTPVTYKLEWVQLLCMLVVLSLSTFALKRALDAALNKDTEAMRVLNQRRVQRRSYHQVSSFDDAIEDAYEERQNTAQELAREQAQRKVAWKRVHAQVFRPPNRAILLALLLGSGIQAACMAILTMVLTLFIGTRNVAGLFIISFPYFGFANGYTAAKFYRFFNGSRWYSLGLLATVFYPSILFSGYYIVDWIDTNFAALLFGKEGISATTFGYLWLFVNLPSTGIGAYQGFTAPRLETPTKQSRLSRDIPECTNLKSRQFRALCAVILPFIAIYLQFGQFSARSLSMKSSGDVMMPKFNEVQTVVAKAAESDFTFDTSQWPIIMFVSVAALMYLIIVAEISIVQTYFLLCDEDYRWQWQSLKNGSSSATLLFILVVIIRFFLGRGQSSVLAQLLSMLMICGTIALISASVAFVASFKFNQYLYGKLSKNLD